MSRILLAIFFIGAGIGHFLIPNFYLRMMPAFLPYPLLLVYLSGVLEVVLGGMAVFSRYRVLALWGMSALLVAVFPANINMALHPELFPEFSATNLWLRLPIQIILIGWVIFSLQFDDSRTRTKT